MNVNLAVEPLAENIFAEEVLPSRFFDGLDENLRAVGHFAPDINVGRMRADRIAGDENALDKLVRIVMEKLPILERAGLGFVGVANQINRLTGALGEKTPLHAAGETRATAPAHLAVFDLGHDLFELHAERFRQRLVTTLAKVVLDRALVTGLAHVGQQHPLLQWMSGLHRRQRLRLQFAGGLDPVDDRLGLVRREILEQLVIDHHHRTSAAGRQAFDRGNREQTIARVLVQFDAEFLLQAFEDATATAEFAGERSAHLDVELAARFGREHRVKRNQLPDVDRLQAELGRGPLDLLLAELAELFLQEMQEPQHCRPFVLRRVVRDDLVDVLLEFCWNIKCHGKIRNLAITLSHHEIEAGEDGDHIAHHIPPGHDG